MHYNNDQVEANKSMYNVYILYTLTGKIQKLIYMQYIQ